MTIGLDDLGKFVTWSNNFVTWSNDYVGKVVMIIKGPSGNQLALFDTKEQQCKDKQTEAIKDFMEKEATWLKLQAETQSSQKTVQS